MLSNLLNFLVDNATLVYYWFRDLIYRTWKMVDSVWDWIYQGAADFFNRAVNYINDNIQKLREWFEAVKSDVWGYIGQVWSDVTKFVSGSIAQIREWITAHVESVRSILAKQINNVREDVQTFVTNLFSTLKATIQNQVDILTARINPFITLHPKIQTLIDFFTPANLTKIQALIDNGFSTVITIAQNPLGFIFGVMWGRFIEFSGFALAYAMGTVKYELPPLPDWVSSPVVNPGGGGAIPPIAASGLVRPIEPLYISGYTFDNSHHGVDFGLLEGQPVYASHSGSVIESGFSAWGYGITVVIQGAEWWSRYAHLQSAAVGVGQEVEAGTIIGYGDSTGNSTGNHLHYEIKYRGEFVDPVMVL